MKLSEVIKKLQEMEKLGLDDMPVFYRHSSSGDCGQINSIRVTNQTDPSTGPFMEEYGYQDGIAYISISVGGN